MSDRLYLVWLTKMCCNSWGLDHLLHLEWGDVNAEAEPQCTARYFYDWLVTLHVAFNQAEARSGTQEDAADEVKGFDFKTLIKNKPELKQELLGFRDHLLASSSAEESLKVLQAYSHMTRLMFQKCVKTTDVLFMQMQFASSSSFKQLQTVTSKTSRPIRRWHLLLSLRDYCRLRIFSTPQKTASLLKALLMHFQLLFWSIYREWCSWQHWELNLLQVWDLKDLGYQASQRIAQSLDPLQSLADISQNFPNLASVLSRTEVSREHRAELKSNQKVLPGGTNFEQSLDEEAIASESFDSIAFWKIK